MSATGFLAFRSLFNKSTFNPALLQRCAVKYIQVLYKIDDEKRMARDRTFGNHYSTFFDEVMGGIESGGITNHMWQAGLFGLDRDIHKIEVLTCREGNFTQTKVLEIN